MNEREQLVYDSINEKISYWFNNSEYEKFTIDVPVADLIVLLGIIDKQALTIECYKNGGITNEKTNKNNN